MGYYGPRDISKAQFLTNYLHHNNTVNSTGVPFLKYLCLKVARQHQHFSACRIINY